MIGHCAKKDGPCECRNNPTLMLFCGHFEMQEQPRDKLDAMSINNFMKLAPTVRADCVTVLSNKTPDAMLQRWRKQADEGKQIGSNDPRFHLGIGMQVRNALREVALDAVTPTGNWDDTYFGALYALVAENNDPTRYLS